MLLAGSLFTANATVVTGNVSYTSGGETSPVGSGVVKLTQDGEVKYQVNVETGYGMDPANPGELTQYANYTIENVAAGDYTLSFYGQPFFSFTDDIYTYSHSVTINETEETMTHDIVAEEDPLHVIMTVVTYKGPEDWMAEPLGGVEVTCRLGEETQYGITDEEYGEAYFLCDRTSTYSLSFHKSGYKDFSTDTKATEIDEWYGDTVALTLEVYMTEDLGTLVEVSGNVSLDGKEWNPNLNMAEQIGLASSMDQSYTSPIENGRYSFPEVPVGDAVLSVLTDGLMPEESKNFRIKSPENGFLNITEGTEGVFTQDIVIERIGADISGKVVKADYSNLSAYATVWIDGVDTIRTEYSGSFTMEGVPEGDYVLKATAQGMDTASKPINVDFSKLNLEPIDAEYLVLKQVPVDFFFYGVTRYSRTTAPYGYDTARGAHIELWDEEGEILLDSTHSDENGYFELTFSDLMGKRYEIRCTHKAIDDCSRFFEPNSTEMDLTNRLSLTARRPTLHAVTELKAEQVPGDTAVRLNWNWPQELLDAYNSTYLISRLTISRKQDLSMPYAEWNSTMYVEGETLPTEYIDTAVEMGKTYFYHIAVAYSAPYFSTMSTDWNDSIKVSLKQMYKLQLQANDTAMGRVQGAGYYEAEQTAHIAALPKEGYLFKAWIAGTKPDTVAKTAEYDFKVCGDTLLTALFEAEPIPVPKKCSLTLTAQPADAGVLSGSGEYDENTKVELNATANEGYRFVAWMSSATDTLSKEAATWFTITCDTALTALFTEETGNEMLDESEWNCYAKDGKIHISHTGTEAVYEIFDIQGRLYARGESSSSLYEIPVSQKGIYIVRFYTDKGIGLKKLLVM